MTQKYINDTIDIKIDASADFEITDEHIVIKSVPITGEIVQEYQDGSAYKPLDEIQSIDVLNIPITFMHPNKQTEDMNVEEIKTIQKGFLRRASDNQKHNDKLYADLVLMKSNDTIHLEQKLRNKESVDVSIGFKFVKDEQKGNFLGREFDYIQRSIKLDHLAILIDNLGQVHPGRAPAPNFGVGADDDQLKKEKMVNDELIKITKDHAELVAKYENISVDKAGLESQVSNDAEEIKSLKAEKVAVDEKLKATVDELKVFKDAEDAKDEEMRKELKEKMPNMAKVFSSADSESIREAHSEMVKAKASAIDGGEGEETSDDQADLDNQFRSVKKGDEE